ncbi:MAG: MFS transporter [Caldilineae bacterium]|nr:MAG: MFS transporter [Caldilineae bacterium]
MKSPFHRARTLYAEYPSQFWVLMGALFIDRVGGALLFPFFSLYITAKFGVGMTEVGVIFGLFSVASIAGGFLGGALTDRLGRKVVLILGLLISAGTSLVMGLVGSLPLFFAAAVLVGLFANASGPASQAMVADLLPEEQRTQGFGIWRVIANLAVTFGPAIGGLLASYDFLYLFLSDAILSTVTAVILFFSMRETKPQPHPDETPQTMSQTFAGYVVPLRDVAFTLFVGATMLMVTVYMQMNTTLAVYLRDVHGTSEQAYGYIISLNAAMVVLFQFPISRWMARFRPMTMMVAGSVLYAVGFAMYGFVSAYVLFLLAMVVITTGEMLTAPTGQALAARFAPEDMRGRYLAIYGFSWGIPAAVGPLLAGLIMDHTDPRWVWYSAGLLGLVAAAAFAGIQRRDARLAARRRAMA